MSTHAPKTLIVLLLVFLAFLSFQNPKEAEDFFITGERLYAEGKYQLAADTLARSAAIFEQLKKPVEQVRAANLQAECYSNLGQCDKAGPLLQHSLDIIGTQSQAVLADTYYFLSRHAGGCARKFDDAIKLMQKSLDIKKSIYKPGDPSFAFDYTFLGYIYNSKSRYDSALMYLDQAIEIRKKQLEADDIETSHTLYNLAATYEGKSDLGRALSTGLQALQIRTKKLGDSHATVANSVNSIGRVYRKLGNTERALEYYRKALEVRKVTLGANHPNVAGSYYEIGNLYGNASNYHASLEYIQQGNRILESNSQVANDILPTYLAYAGKMYGLIGQHDNAKTYIQKAVALVDKLPPGHAYRAVVYNIAGEYYADAGDQEKQSEFFNKALPIYRTSYGENSEREGDVLAKMAAFYATHNYPAEGLSLYEAALSVYEAKLGPQNPKVASVYLGIADIHSLNKDFPEALQAYRRAIKSTDTLNKPLLSKIMRSKARAEKGRASLNSYLLALKLTDEIAQGYNNEASRIQLEKEKKEMCAEAMDVAWDLHTTTSDQSIMKDAFMIAEKSKSALLLENTRDQQAKTMAGVPDSLVEKERDMRIELSYYKTSHYQSIKNKDTAAVTAFEKNIFDTQRKLEQFKSRLERDFPSYFRLKYNHESVSLATVQQQLPDSVDLVQYFVGKEAIYRFQISRKGSVYEKLRFDEAFKSVVSSYQKSLTDFSYIMNDQANSDYVYKFTARELFKMLLPKIINKKLIIVPDDFLAQFSFGTLLYEDIKEQNFAALPYLGTKYTVSYAYSSSLLINVLSDPKKRGNDFAGFAPSYDKVDYGDIDSAAHPIAALVVRSGNLPLPGAIKEVNLISKLMDGKSWINDEATETNFKKHSGEYDVLHLAMHSLLNDEDPRYSELLFNQKGDSENDGYLTIAEIYNLKLNAQLVVLSACSSGFGKIQLGEGPISLSRAFSYAGCPSVVMSLWKVPDLVTTNIMKNFYESLNEGLSKDEALRAAQTRFLRENSDPIYRHPYYWAGFVVIGDTSPIEPSAGYWMYVVAGSLIIAVGVVLMYRRRK